MTSNNYEFDIASAYRADARNAAMRGDPPYTTQPRTPAETAGFVDHNPPADPEPAKPDDIDEILRKHLRVTGENIRLREELAQARKARDAAQELLEAERQKCAKIEADGAQQAFSMGEAMGAVTREKAAMQEKIGVLEKEREFLLTDNRENRSAKYRLMSALDTEKLLRVNDAGTIADLQRRLREAEGQLKRQREAEQLRAQIETMPVTVRGEPTVARKLIEAENTELRRTLGIVGKYLAELTELVSDPADEKRKEPKP